MTSPRDTVFVIVPGSFAYAKVHEKVSTLLREQGKEVIDVELLSVNDATRLPAPQMTDDAADIRKTITSVLDSGKNVVLAMQSYGGVPGTEAVKGLGRKDRGENASAVTGLLYAGAFVPSEGQSVRDILGEGMPEPYKSGVPGQYFDLMPADFAGYVFSDVTDPAEMAKYHGYMSRHSSDTYSGKASYAAWKDIPGTSIIPEKDLIIPPEVQERSFAHTAENGGKLKRVLAKDGGHVITVSQPQLVVDELLELAKNYDRCSFRCFRGICI